MPSSLAALFDAAYAALAFRLAPLAPVAVLSLRTMVDMPEEDVVEVTLSGMAVRFRYTWLPRALDLSALEKQVEEEGRKRVAMHVRKVQTQVSSGSQVSVDSDGEEAGSKGKAGEDVGISKLAGEEKESGKAQTQPEELGDETKAAPVASSTTLTGLPSEKADNNGGADEVEAPPSVSSKQWKDTSSQITEAEDPTSYSDIIQRLPEQLRRPMWYLTALQEDRCEASHWPSLLPAPLQLMVAKRCRNYVIAEAEREVTAVTRMLRRLVGKNWAAFFDGNITETRPNVPPIALPALEPREASSLPSPQESNEGGQEDVPTSGGIERKPSDPLPYSTAFPPPYAIPSLAAAQSMTGLGSNVPVPLPAIQRMVTDPGPRISDSLLADVRMATNKDWMKNARKADLPRTGNSSLEGEVVLTPLPFIPGAKIRRYCGRVNLHFIRVRAADSARSSGAQQRYVVFFICRKAWRLDRVAAMALSSVFSCQKRRRWPKAISGPWAGMHLYLSA